MKTTLPFRQDMILIFESIYVCKKLNNDTFWTSDSFAFPSKTKCKNIVKMLLGPKRSATHNFKVDAFIKLMLIEMTRKI